MFTVDAQVVNNMLKSYDRTEDTILEDVTILKEWMKTQPHLPEIMDESRIQNFLMINKCSIEKAKQKIDMYYTIRSMIPDMFENINPELPNMKRILDILYFIPLPKLTKEMSRVYIYKMRNKDLIDEKEPHDVIAHLCNTLEMRLEEDRMFKDVLIIDMEDIAWTYLLKLTPAFLGKAICLYEKLYSIRIKDVYFVNSPPFLNTLFFLVKNILKAKILKKIHVYQDSNILPVYFPKEMLPRDYGGEEKSLEELQELLKLKFVEYKERFDQLDHLRVNETLRPEKLTNVESLEVDAKVD